MPTVGSTSHQSDSAIFNDGATYNQYATLYTMPADGRITRVGGWLAGYGGSCSFRFCIWSGGKDLLRQSSLVTAASRSFGVGNSQNYEANLTSPYDASEGQSIWVGWARNDAGGMQVDLDNNGAYTLIKRYRANWPGSMDGFDTTADRKLNIYFEYEDPNPDVLVRRSGSWEQVNGVYVRRSGSWDNVNDLVYVRRSGAWEKA